jgi:hypothetical protein
LENLKAYLRSAIAGIRMDVREVKAGHLLQRGERHRGRTAAAVDASCARWLDRLADVIPCVASTLIVALRQPPRCRAR